jgi:hypothetical protein
MASSFRVSGGSHCDGERPTWWIMAGDVLYVTLKEGGRLQMIYRYPSIYEGNLFHENGS